jgi:LysR family transcriptional regulator (chromosome initiation inhibitor)
VHRRGSFDLAAAELHVTPSTISQRLKALEETAGTLLIRH